MDNLKLELNDVKSRIKHVESVLKDLVKRQEELEEQCVEADRFSLEDKKKISYWNYNQDSLSDYPDPEYGDLVPLDNYDEYEEVASKISENLDFDTVSEYDLAFLFGHYMANILMDSLYDSDVYPEEEEDVKEYDIYFQVAGMLLMGVKVMLQEVAKREGVLEGFKKALDNFGGFFEELTRPELIEMLTAIVKANSGYSVTMTMETGNQDCDCSLEPKAEKEEDTPKKKKVTNKTSLESEISMEDIIKKKLGL